MLAPRTRIILVRSVVSITGAALLIAAFGISNDFTTLKWILTICFVTLSLLSFLMDYRDLSIIGALLALLYNPIIPVALPRHIWVIVDVITFVGIIYYTYWTTNPHWKGTRFEQYITTLFPEPEFTIVDRTRDTSKFLDRKVESDGHPDFVLRHNVSGTVFALECKWRGQWSYNRQAARGIWWDRWRNEHYIAFGKERSMPVYVAFGIGGAPERPKEVYFLDAQRLHYSFLLQSLICSGKTTSTLIRTFAAEQQ